jgi:peptidoglycan-associated lipoprotein
MTDPSAGESTSPGDSATPSDSADISGESGSQEAIEEEDLDAQRRQAEAAAQAAREKQEAREAFTNIDIYFDYDSAVLKTEAQQKLQEKADFMKADKEVTVIIEGHCDSRGTNEYNLALGEKRARTVMDYMVTLGISPKRFTIISYGEERPQAVGDTEEDWALNRRAHFVIEP